MTDAACGEGNAYPSGAPDFTLKKKKKSYLSNFMPKVIPEK